MLQWAYAGALAGLVISLPAGFLVGWLAGWREHGVRARADEENGVCGRCLRPLEPSRD